MRKSLSFYLSKLCSVGNYMSNLKVINDDKHKCVTFVLSLYMCLYRFKLKQVFTNTNYPHVQV